MDSFDSLVIQPYQPLLLVSPLNAIQCPHRVKKRLVIWLTAYQPFLGHFNKSFKQFSLV